MATHSLLIAFLNLFLAHQCFVAHGSSSSNTFTSLVCETYIKPGQITIGGMFDIYQSINSPCDGELRGYAISLVESMTYAIDLINKRDDVLPNISLGYEIRNDCQNEDISLWTMLTMTSPSGNAEYAETCPDSSRGGGRSADKVLAVIGPVTSSASLLAVKLGRMYAVPVISYYATSDELSNTDRFPFFFRTIPPDRFQVGAIIDLLRYYNWRYIALFYSINSYGIHGARQIQLLAEKYDICIAINMPVSGEESLTSEKDEIEDKLRSSDKATVVVLFTYPNSAKAVLRVMKNIGRKFIVIGSDGWGPDAADYDGLVSEGALFVRFSSVHTSAFQDYYKDLPAHQEHASQWYRDYLSKLIAENDCTGWETCGMLPEAHHVAESIIDSVHAIAYALNASLQGPCNVTGSCNEAFDGWTIKDSLHRVSFSARANHTFQFDENGDVADKYDMKTWQSSDDGRYRMVKVGVWDPYDVANPLHLREDLMKWGTDDGMVPSSLCIIDCKPGYVSIPLEKKCCLGCRKCSEYAIVVKKNETSAASCLECSVTHWPDATFTKCTQITPSYIPYQGIVFVLSSTGAGIGLILTAVSAIGHCYYAQHALIKSSSRELSSLNIIGLAFSCIVVLVILARPAAGTCVLVDVCIATCVCMTFSPVLLKVNRIWRIFNATKGQRPRYTGPRQQVAIAAMIIIVQIIISCVSIFFAASTPEILLPIQRKPYLEIFCQFSYGFLASCTYNMLIIIACCYFAFRARHVPSNYNESKFIAVSVYSTLIVCLAALPVYTTAIDVSQKILTLTVVLLFNTYLTLACLYLPKIYAINFAGEEAQRSWRTGALTMNTGISSVAPAPEPAAATGAS